ncbi:MAG: hypothetical protein ACREOR_01070, partial [Candidatus Binatia bacterium]
ESTSARRKPKRRRGEKNLLCGLLPWSPPVKSLSMTLPNLPYYNPDGKKRQLKLLASAISLADRPKSLAFHKIAKLVS